VVTGAVFSLAALIALPVAWALAGPPALAAADLAIVAWLGVMSTGIAYLLFSHALRHISGATGVALALAEPCVAFALAVAVVGERPGWLALAGLLGVLAGLALVVREELAPARAPDARRTALPSRP
jgi:DME family drug/metabolite transporter